MPANKYWYGLTSDYQKDSAYVVMLSRTHRWTDGSSLKTSLRDGNYARDLRATQASFTAGTTFANLSDNKVVSRGASSAGNAKAGKEHHTFLQRDYLITTQWLGLKNSLLIGGEYAVEKSRRFDYPFLSVANGGQAKTSTMLGNPNSVGLGGNLAQRLITDFKATTLGLYAQDTIALTPYWKLVASLRLDNFKGDYERPGSPTPNNTTLSRSDKLLSKRLGVMYQPTDEVSYYAAYGTSFNTAGDLHQYHPLTANAPPESIRNYEVGAKWELMGGDLSLRTALARTEKYNERNTDIDTANNSYLLSGKRHYPCAQI